jgi:cell division protein FtsW (lipid II flippase)
MATLDRLFSRRNLVGTVVFSAFCVGCLGLMSDFGTALIFFVAFLVIAFLRTGDLPSVVMVVAAAVFACMIIVKFKPYIVERFAVWRHVWEDPSNMGYQQTRTMSAIASGGLFGLGGGQGEFKKVAASSTDLVFGMVAEELGLIVALCTVACIVIFALFAVKSSASARSSFYVIGASAVAAMFVTQTMLNVFGCTDLLPLTGVTLPFVSTGGSSMMSCWALLAYIKAADTRQNASFAVKLPGRKRRDEQPPDEDRPEWTGGDRWEEPDYDEADLLDDEEFHIDFEDIDDDYDE